MSQDTPNTVSGLGAPGIGDLVMMTLLLPLMIKGITVLRFEHPKLESALVQVEDFKLAKK